MTVTFEVTAEEARRIEAARKRGIDMDTLFSRWLDDLPQQTQETDDTDLPEVLNLPPLSEKRVRGHIVHTETGQFDCGADDYVEEADDAG